MKNKLYYISLASIMLALLIVCSQLTIPLPVIPLTLQTLAVGLLASILPLRYSLQTILVYLLLGFIGLPIFANFKGGLGVLFSNTGGYLLGFLVYVIVVGSLVAKKQTFGWLLVANSLGAIMQLLCGSLWLLVISDINLENALLLGTVPFLLPGAVKVILVCICAQIYYREFTKRSAKI
ncbi:biotin transporter BioY [Ligilactobacillus animalis]|uniref:biotin transporter BioY n=1 Tax=Ligilactobacillus animalis TaxID=1605 RepID=UPI003511CEE6